MMKRREMAYAEICKTIKKKTREDIRKYNQEITREMITASKSLKKVRRAQKLGQERLITLTDKQGREIHDQDKIIERMEELYSELYESKQRTIIHTVPKEVPELTSWELEATLRDRKNGT